jgi:hypothetical protein
MIWTHVWLLLFHYSWSFVCVSFHVITWLLCFYCQDYVSYTHVLSSFDPNTQCLYRWSRLWRCMSPQKIFFYYHLPTQGRAGVKLGDAWYVSNVLTRCHSASSLFSAVCLFMLYALCLFILYACLLHFVAFFMLYACLYTICFVFCYTSWHFYAFSRTNLLTRCHSASSLFSAIFVFQKSYTGNILGIGWNKSRTSYFFQSFTKTEDEMEGGQELGSP